MPVIQTLPNELLCAIFAACLPAPPISPSPRTAPLLLAHVCSRWRDVAFAMPELWSSLIYRTTAYDTSDALLHAWLRRAQSQPVLLAVEHGEHRRFYEDTFSTIFGAGANLHELHVRSAIARSPTAQKVAAPTLRSLVLVPGAIAALTWLHLPALIRLDAHATFEIPALRAFLALPTTDLTHLTIHIARNTVEGQLVDLLCDLTTLESLSVDEDRNIWLVGGISPFLLLVSSSPTRLLLPRLQHLAVKTALRGHTHPPLMNLLRS
ncbi:hypothetical protein MKEN_00276900 [Mycena kentingensis (nom. inval.)]|nr:hypothetical protein MKEN_00276900 [Mycena kentingensis (nom. inval.)]